ncbi:hypothetical protein [methane-oxidizing endosymbiont of Gigantopelta aegis]|uniref:hypothetical protein n=1 Tax=methane-oxidizing endosymbiont of Gigantopelta aegis TaxID=2794938 RepID=UPI001FDA4E24|nr:hypothetical protein [methane-oxidizing endosymbiont of Gigantopelta aegis]
MPSFKFQRKSLLLCGGLWMLLFYSYQGIAQPNILLEPQLWQRDPFTPSLLMYEQLGNQTQPGFIPSLQQGRIPRMKLLGLITRNKGEYLALLEIQGVGTFMVREGDEFNIDPSHPKSAIRISKITRLSVTVETGRMGRIQVLR